MKIIKLTIEEAIAQGYKSCGYPDSEFPYLKKLDKVTESDLDDGIHGKLYLAEKEPYYIPKIDPKTIADILADYMISESSDNTGDDTDDVYNIVFGIDFSSTAEMINNALAHKKYYQFTSIELTNKNNPND